MPKTGELSIYTPTKRNFILAWRVSRWMSHYSEEQVLHKSWGEVLNWFGEEKSVLLRDGRKFVAHAAEIGEYDTPQGTVVEAGGVVKNPRMPSRRGYGKAVVRGLLNTPRMQQPESVIAVVNKQNEASLALFRNQAITEKEIPIGSIPEPILNEVSPGYVQEHYRAFLLRRSGYSS